MPIQVSFDFGAFNAQQKIANKRGAAARKWMSTQQGNVLAEARDQATTPARLDEIAHSATAPSLTAVAGNPSAWPETLLFLSEGRNQTEKICGRLARNPRTPAEALQNVAEGTYGVRWHHAETARAHKNWPKDEESS